MGCCAWHGGEFQSPRDHDLVAQFYSLPVNRDTPPDTLTPARHGLRQTIAVVDRVSRETEAAAEQVHRLTDVVAAHDRLQAQLRESYDRDQAATGRWIASGHIGPDPARETRGIPWFSRPASCRVLSAEMDFAINEQRFAPRPEQVRLA